MVGHVQRNFVKITCGVVILVLEEKKNTLEGRVITFDEEEVKLFKYLGDLWTELQ